MKRVFQHPSGPSTGKRYWRSLGELSDTPEFREWLEREFPAGVAELNGAEWSRRSLLKLIGASMALAGFGLNGCRRPEAHLVPFTKNVEWTIPGKFLYYATAMPRRTGAIPLIATTVDGRPIKLEGNPLHPGRGGATDTFAHARTFARRTGEDFSEDALVCLRTAPERCGKLRHPGRFRRERAAHSAF